MYRGAEACSLRHGHTSINWSNWPRADVRERVQPVEPDRQLVSPNSKQKSSNLHNARSVQKETPGRGTHGHHGPERRDDPIKAARPG